MIQESYVGNILIANPKNPQDSLERSLILIVTDTEDMSLGLQLNKPMLETSLTLICDQMNIFIDSDDPVYYGGSLHSNKIHVIHSNDWSGFTTIKINNEISVTNDISVLTALAAGEGPEFYRACAGFCAWEAGKLDDQIKSKNNKIKHRWEVVKATQDLVFDTGDGIDQWHKVLSQFAQQRISSWF